MRCGIFRAMQLDAAATDIDDEDVHAVIHVAMFPGNGNCDLFELFNMTSPLSEVQCMQPGDHAWLFRKQQCRG